MLLREEAQRLWHRLGRLVELEELVALGHTALLEVARSFDPQRASFRTYASRKLRWAILDGIRRDTHGRVPTTRAKALGASERLGRAGRAKILKDPGLEPEQQHRSRLRGILRDHAGALAVGLIAASGDMAEATDPQENPEQISMRLAAVRQLQGAVEQLPDRERELVRRHYFGEERFDRIALDLGISKSRASRLHTRAIRTLATTLRESDPTEITEPEGPGSSPS